MGRRMTAEQRRRAQECYRRQVAERRAAGLADCFVAGTGTEGLALPDCPDPLLDGDGSLFGDIDLSSVVPVAISMK